MSFGNRAEQNSKIFMFLHIRRLFTHTQILLLLNSKAKSQHFGRALNGDNTEKSL